MLDGAFSAHLSAHSERERVGGVLWLEAVRTLLISKCPSPARASTPVGVPDKRPAMGSDRYTRSSNQCRHMTVVALL